MYVLTWMGHPRGGSWKRVTRTDENEVEALAGQIRPERPLRAFTRNPGR